MMACDMFEENARERHQEVYGWLDTLINLGVWTPETLIAMVDQIAADHEQRQGGYTAIRDVIAAHRNEAEQLALLWLRMFQYSRGRYQ